MQQQGFKCLIASLSGSSDRVLLESDALPLMMAHAGSAPLQPDDVLLAPAQVESVLKSLAPGTAAFRAAGAVVIQDLPRSQGLSQPHRPSDAATPSSATSRLAGWGTPQQTPGREPAAIPVAVQAAAAVLAHRRPPALRVSMRMLAKYLARLDAIRQCSTGRA